MGTVKKRLSQLLQSSKKSQPQQPQPQLRKTSLFRYDAVEARIQGASGTTTNLLARGPLEVYEVSNGSAEQSLLLCRRATGRADPCGAAPVARREGALRAGRVAGVLFSSPRRVWEIEFAPSDAIERVVAALDGVMARVCRYQVSETVPQDGTEELDYLLEEEGDEVPSLEIPGGQASSDTINERFRLAMSIRGTLPKIRRSSTYFGEWCSSSGGVLSDCEDTLVSLV
ncbi:uncharacterized protein KNAG_0I02430 [Huiozyma naganishii CBS 8797]|uniref:Inheritance of peroxisomes protein 1 n=1 Tax=Huiozyma naganishii (strain ATCC MYA-139 / BCRC 22969 / CBS 8797 / KCTC 17520 / NBRC 10181 / NCYC 3082 / Yp74L-3) TaxID=1071383 RepID=J7S9D4_HUIN7|nr:hypothetical protein KNAG_0I02430 [Kazachstania naganishii CBS 8797]CCK72029.1 hypothetical protein KNAG_0I02430 [Kazachstania naganishii CBS 8797]